MEIPKQYDPAAAQEKWSAFWEDKKYFAAAPNPAKKPYTIVIPPPNVTGALHLGHALNNTLQDIMIRHKRMSGFEALWIPGVDHAGIATQAVVERRLFDLEKKTRHDVGREGLVERIWQWKEQYQTRIIAQLKGMGCSCDWNRTRFTLDPVCAKAVRHFFFGLFRAGLIYRGKRLVNWDTHLQTAVSDDEVFHETVQGHFWYIRYPVMGPKPGEPAFVTVATTRPETMLGDTAVAVHPNPRAAFEAVETALYEALATATAKERDDIQKEIDALRIRREDILPLLETLARMAGQGRMLNLPLLDRPIPLVCDEWAKPHLGTGCVKITPAHDPNDYEVALRRDLPMLNILHKNGMLNDFAGPYEGLNVKKAREKVVADLEARGLLDRVEEREIELAHSDRSKTPIEPFLNDQWFVKMAGPKQGLAQNAIDAVNPAGTAHPGEKTEKVNIFPSRYTKGYVDWLAEKRDWPIGRQLWWGHRIPIWYCDASEAGATEADLQKAFAGRDDIAWHRDAGNAQWWICSEEEDLPTDAVPGCTLIREEDVLDTWFSSALWPHSTLGWPDKTPEMDYFYPTSVLITSRDIITLWVARMVLASKFNTGKKPFEEVYIHPKILDKYGEGMSKSKGNGVDPLAVMAKFGADALRFALAHLTTESQDIRLALDFECPHCGAVVEQTKKNRVEPKITCPKCKKPFKTQWAESAEDQALPEGAVIGERFEAARNFCNKLWNAARFVIMNIGESKSKWNDPPASYVGDLWVVTRLEDRWILSRLATVTKTVTESINSYRYADAAKALYDFARDEFCSFYVEMVKSRLNDGEESVRSWTQLMLLAVLDSLIRLLHPIVPFVTEEIWQRLREFKKDAPESITIAAWPQANEAAIDPEIEKRFAVFQELLRAVREVRASRNVPPKTEIAFAVRCDAQTAALLQPMAPYFLSMAAARATGWGSGIPTPPLASTVALTGMEVIVDLAELIDIAAEKAKKVKEIAKLNGLIAAKEAKLGGDFVQKAPERVVEAERKSLADWKEQLAACEAALGQLETMKAGTG